EASVGLSGGPGKETGVPSRGSGQAGRGTRPSPERKLQGLPRNGICFAAGLRTSTAPHPAAACTFLARQAAGQTRGAAASSSWGPNLAPLSLLVKRKEHEMSGSCGWWWGPMVAVALGGVVQVAAQAACCYFSAKDKDILQPAQKVFITWDPAEKVESFTVQPKFEGNALDFGMVIPTPSKPKLDEMPRDFFKELAV